jgi:predicted RNA binding protein YcfA (HicA-like mRNA interferase family)
MTKHQKVVARLLAKPSDFEWRELKVLMETFGYELKTTGGSGRKFIHPETRATLFLHEPHPGKILKAYQVKDAIHFLKQEGHIQ